MSSVILSPSDCGLAHDPTVVARLLPDIRRRHAGPDAGRCAIDAGQSGRRHGRRAPLTGSAERGKELTYTCQGCHGVTGYKNAYPNYHVPRIGGQSPQYLVNALTEYKEGKRKHPTMQAQAQTLLRAGHRRHRRLHFRPQVSRHP